ncbi:MAG: glutamate--cysteine ligase [Candidatus Omnitrophica bacterium]|nr:glutamate--cysteine ligase [Candidatus Omnitrophota bacterium]
MALEHITQAVAKHGVDVESWLCGLERDTPVPIYSSLDIRAFSSKLAVVDTNLFPAGFNNLCEHGLADGARYFGEAIRKEHPSVRRIQVFAEAHTRNPFYMEHLARLQELIENAGFEVSVVQDVEKLGQSPPPDLILANNDASAGVPEPLQNTEIPIIPSLQAGWHARLKSQHFAFAQPLLEHFGALIGMDPWLVSTVHTSVEGVDLVARKGVQALQDAVAGTLERIEGKYREHNIDHKPYVFAKSDSGTYGMGILHFESPEEVVAIGRRAKNKLHSAKGGGTTHRFLVQEGIPTNCRMMGSPCEVCVYQIQNRFIGGFYRKHEKKDEKQSLNSPGMSFHKMCPHRNTYNSPGCGCHGDCNVFDLYRILSRIAGVAAGREIEELAEVNPSCA